MNEDTDDVQDSVDDAGTNLPPMSIEDLQAALFEATKDAQDNRTGWMRTQADFENFRKRKESESVEWVDFGKQAAFVQILPILDSFEQSLVHAPDIEDPKFTVWKNGLVGIIRQIDDALTKMGIQKIDALGKKFDPNFHEAVREVDAPPGTEPGMVSEQYQTGYTLNGKMLRPAQVAITK